MRFSAVLLEKSTSVICKPRGFTIRPRTTRTMLYLLFAKLIKKAIDHMVISSRDTVDNVIKVIKKICDDNLLVKFIRNKKSILDYEGLISLAAG